MFRLISILIILQFIIAQKKEILVIFNGNNSKMTKFEISLISNLLFEYSKSSGERIKLKYKGVKKFNNTFQIINSGHRDKTLAVNTISITKDRQKKFDFSIPYVKNSYSYLSTKEFNYSEGSPLRVGYVKNTLYESLIKKQSDKSVVEKKAYNNVRDCIKDMKSQKIDVIFTDYIDAWAYDLKFIKAVSKEANDKFGIMFPKGSKLKKDLDLIFAKFSKTDKFYKLIEQNLGAKAVKYFKEG